MFLWFWIGDYSDDIIILYLLNTLSQNNLVLYFTVLNTPSSSTENNKTISFSASARGSLTSLTS
jgi:hypothetical protein